MIEVFKEIAFGLVIAAILVPIGMWVGLNILFALVGRPREKEGKGDRFDLF